MKTMRVVLLAVPVLACLSAPALAADKTNVPLTEKSLHWTDTKVSVSVFLVQRKTTPPGYANAFSLFVAGGDDLTIVYRSRVNSTIPIVRVLKPKATSSIKGMQEFEFKHGFSKTTIWMAIVFEKDGRRIEQLTRTFYGSMDKVVPNNKFLETPGREKPQQRPPRDKK